MKRLMIIVALMFLAACAPPGYGLPTPATAGPIQAVCVTPSK